MEADTLAGVWDAVIINILSVLEGLSIVVVIDSLTELLTNALSSIMLSGVNILDEGLTILVSATMIASGFVVPVAYSVEALAGDWAGSAMESVGARIGAVVDTLTEVTIICVVSGTIVGVLAEVDTNMLCSANITALGFIKDPV